MQCATDHRIINWLIYKQLWSRLQAYPRNCWRYDRSGFFSRPDVLFWCQQCWEFTVIEHYLVFSLFTAAT